MRSSARKLGEPPTSALKNETTPPVTRKSRAAEPKKDTPKAEPKKETPKTESKKDTPKPETSKPEPKKDTPKPESKPEPKKEAQKAETSKPEQKKETSKTPQPDYKVGDKVLCLHKGSHYYEAKIQSESVLENGATAYLVHYQGWNSRYDEYIEVTELHNRFKPYTTEAAAEAKIALREATGGSSKKPKNRAGSAAGNASMDASKIGTPTGTAASSRSSTPFESNKRRQPKDVTSTGSDSGGKRSRPSTAKSSSDTAASSPLATLIPPSQLGLIGQSVTSALAQQAAASAPQRKPLDTFLENFPHVFCEILRADHEKIQKGQLPIMPARVTISDIVGDYKESLGQYEQPDNTLHIEYGTEDSLEQTTPAFLSLCADGLLDCFDSFIRTDLLYKAEWEAHDKKFKVEKTPEKKPQTFPPPHEHYGVVHLLRLLSKINTFLERLQLQRDIRYASQSNIQDFVAFVNKNIRTYFDADQDYK